MKKLFVVLMAGLFSAGFAGEVAAYGMTYDSVIFYYNKETREDIRITTFTNRKFYAGVATEIAIGVLKELKGFKHVYTASENREYFEYADSLHSSETHYIVFLEECEMFMMCFENGKYSDICVVVMSSNIDEVVGMIIKMIKKTHEPNNGE